MNVISDSTANVATRRTTTAMEPMTFRFIIYSTEHEPAGNLGTSSPAEAESQKNERHRDQRDAGDLFGSLADLFADPRPEPQAQLGRGERLDGDPYDGERDGQTQQARAQANRQLVDADAQAEVQDGQAAGVGQEAQPPLFIVFVLAWADEQEARDEQEQDASVAGPLAEETAHGAS